MQKEELRERIESLSAEVDNGKDELRKLKNELRELESREYIQANQITAENLELSEGEDKPYFPHIQDFSFWLLQHSDKKYAEWNEVIMEQKDLKEGRLVYTPARVRHVPGIEKKAEAEEQK